ncbi:MAG TPA: copper homeostasis protein CutC [Planctomycetota bacterium]|nr:copper homeostasis protein CutC [Planctomycetota bacterium]
MLIEICVDSAAGLEAALQHGAERLEVCSRLDLGGLTPTVELLDAALARGVRVHAMVRPYANPSFVPDDAEFEELRADLARVKAQGAHGVVLGILKPQRVVDVLRTGELVRLARPLPVTFHRAFDRVVDPRSALEDLIELGIERVLTSAGAPTAVDGMAALRELVQQARGRIVVMPGGGVREQNAAEIVARTGACELHGSVPFRWPT